MTVERPDLSARRALSKSALSSFDMCNQKAFQTKYHPMPFIRGPKVTFGSCVDAGVEVLIACARAGIPLDIDRAAAASFEVQERDGIEVDQDEARLALERFAADIIPAHDWHSARTQAHISFTDLHGWGEVDGHPDIVFGTNVVVDVKTGNRRQTAKTLELGFYALLVEEETGDPVPEVGYFCWVRNRKPEWQTLFAYVDDPFREWTRRLVSRYVTHDRADTAWNSMRLAKGLEPQNIAFSGNPKSWSLCFDCAFNSKNGGSCDLPPVTDEEVA